MARARAATPAGLPRRRARRCRPRWRTSCRGRRGPRGGDAFGRASIAANTWYQLTAVLASASTEIYVNGVDVGSASGLTSSETGHPLVIGSPNAPAYPTEWLTGSIDEVRVWNRALSSTEIADTYNCELFSGSGLVASYQFNQGVPSGSNAGTTTLLDTSGNGRNGTLAGFALSGSTSNWVSPGGVAAGMTCP